jgi:hypothetical protein
MFGRRLYRRRSFRRRSYGISRYVTDTIAFQRPVTGATNRICLVSETSTAGIREVRRFPLELSTNIPVMFALIYFPEGIDPENGTLNASAGDSPTSLYTPEQHIPTSGIIRDSPMTIARATRGRSLSNRDSVFLLWRPFALQGEHQLQGKVTYSIGFASTFMIIFIYVWSVSYLFCSSR